MVFIYLLTLALVANVHAGCSRSNWGLSFDNEGLSKCDNGNTYIKGFYRSANIGRDDYIYRLENAECCDATHPWSGVSPLVVNADWWDTLANNRWVSCPQGHFLQGLYRTGNGNGMLHNIEEGRCAKPVGHPHSYGHCYDQDILHCFDNAGDCRCNNDYFVTGFYRGGCNWLYCLETLRCCKMAPQTVTLDETYKVKNLVMEKTQAPLALLAHYLGYGWCSGCRAPYVGEDFRRNGDRWEADKSGRCSGYKSDHRLNIDYRDWGFAIKDIRFGNHVLEELRPETVDSGTLYNNDVSPATKTVTRSEESIRSVTHTTTSSWKRSLELGIEINYTPPSVTGGVGGSVSYKFGYETSSSTTDSTNNQQKKTFSVSEQKTLAPHSAVNWRLVMSKTRTTIPYTATVIAKFSAELQGFLRWGGGSSDPNTNYHYNHRGSGDRPTVNYRFGDGSTPFYTALKRQRETNSRPWLWSDMINAHSGAQGVINQLTNENYYVFTLTGKFEDVIGKHVEFRWDTAPLTRRRRRSVETPGHANSTVDFKHLINVAKAMPDDTPAPNPDPPRVNLSNSLNTPMQDGNGLGPQLPVLKDKM